MSHAPTRISNAAAADIRGLRQLIAPFRTALRFRELIAAMLRQELAARFRNSVLGWTWAIVGPLVTLGLYTIAFNSALRLPVARSHGGIANYALFVFVGMIIFNLFSELIYRAPQLMHDHAARIKSSLFPSETLAWIAVLRGFVSAAISLGVLLVFQLLLTGRVPLLLPGLILTMLPLTLFLLGAVWFLAAIGAFARDVGYLMITIVPVMMIISPVFYTVTGLPEDMQLWVWLNPLSAAIEFSRALILDTAWPPPLAYAWLWVAGILSFRGGYVFFMRYKGILVDVI